MAQKKSKFVYFCNRVYYALYCVAREVNSTDDPALEKMAEIRAENMASGAMGCITWLTMVFLLDVLSFVFGINSKTVFGENDMYFSFFSLVLVLLFLYFVFWKKSKYLYYFKMYENESFNKHMAWNICTYIYCILLFLVQWYLLKYL